jgi:hypothetical protein
MKKVFILLFTMAALSASSAQIGQKDSVISTRDGIVTLSARQILAQVNVSRDGWYAISKLSDLEKIRLLRGEIIPRYEAIGHLPGADFPLFYRIEAAYNSSYASVNGILEVKRARADRKDGGEYGLTITAYAMILFTMLWVLRRPNEKEKTKLVGVFFLSSAIVLFLSMLSAYAISWAIFSISKVYEITAIGFFGSLVAIVSAVVVLIITVLSVDTNVDWMEIAIVLIMSFVFNISAGIIAGLEFGLFSRQAEALWIFFGLYLAAGALSLLIRIIICFFRRWNQPIIIDMTSDPDIAKLV